jgi:hypothetical protein
MWQVLPSVATAYLHLTGRVSKPCGAGIRGVSATGRAASGASGAVCRAAPDWREMAVTAAPSSHVLTQECMTEYSRSVIGVGAAG